MQKFLCFLTIILFCSACSTGLPRKAGPADGSMAVSGSNLDLMPALRRSLETLNWRLVPYESDTTTGANPQLADRARYRMQQTSSRVGNCTAASGLFAYKIAILENQSGDTVVELSGSGCETQITDRFERYLRREGIVPPE